MLVSASFLSNSYSAKDLIEKIEKSNADYIHVDYMDGKFVSNKTETFNSFNKELMFCHKPLDVHLMVKNPEDLIKKFSLLNTEYITIHLECNKDITKYINLTKSYGIKVGISIKPDTDVKDLFPYLNKIDLVLIMTVEPGKSGQEFMPSVLYKVEALRKEIDEKKYNTIISVDGGINYENALLAYNKGANMAVSASYLYNGNYEENVDKLKNIK